MNFLAHLFLGPKDPEQALGSLLGDFVRGPVGRLDLPQGVREGIWLHRRIDSFTDAHPLVQRSRERVSPERRRYAGIMIDMFYDHLLASHWQTFSDQPLEQFTQDIYAVLLDQQPLIPEQAWPTISRMAEHDWLCSYARLTSLHRALDAISLRLKRSNPLPGSAIELEHDYAGFKADFMAYMPQVMAYATDQAAELTGAKVSALTVASVNPKA
ncbi:ACP phosphodiesterase [Halopseudomonas pelagia]|uniref:acyl carrier protein phosphodiesterase n=1 Tax=Halopseudomonas pelagia TaxID=553151 RepID=UPI0003B3D9AF|nr:ACP phosphodiesterase [Halopseudomonas pelagia]|tara:strand:- start:17741 stop:18379 length:639 start_codon:yes stop_codon:yes gene_type:complete